ncbi:MAG: histidine kinase dimerization/phosphoacceptor domain -containing protein [Gemmatimonadota bacterium]
MSESPSAARPEPADGSAATAATRQERRLQVYRRVRDAIWRMGDPEDVSGLLAEIRRGLLELELPLMYCGVNIVDATADPPTVISHSVDPRGQRHRLQSVGARTVLGFWQRQEVAYRRDLAREDPYGEHPFFPRVGCIVDVPFSHGTLAASSAVAEAFSPDDIHVLEEMALLVEDGFRRMEELRRLQVQHRLREQVWRMRRTDDIVQVMVVLRENLGALGFRYTACAINVVERRAHGVELRAHNMRRDSGWTVLSSEPQPIIETFWRAGVPVYRRDLEAEDVYGERQAVSALYGVPIRSILDVPFSHGTLALNSTEASAFSEAQVALLQQMAAVLSEGFRRMADLQALEDRNYALEMEVADRRRAEQRLAASLEEKVVLLREIHHRVKNNLQLVTSLLHLSAQSLRHPEAREQFNESRARIESMALVHERLYESEDLARVDCEGYLRALVDSLLRAYGASPGQVRALVRAPGVKLDADRAMQCGLIVNELVSNCLKHAFSGAGSGSVEVEMTEVDGQVTLRVRDDGVGLPVGLEPLGSGSLGLQLVSALSAQLGGTPTWQGQPGTAFQLEFLLRPLGRDGGGGRPASHEASLEQEAADGG